MTGVQEHTLQLIWRFCANFEKVDRSLAGGDATVDREG